MEGVTFMKKRRAIFKTRKERGEWAESMFLVRATEHGIHVSKPWGDSRSYDFVVGRPRRFAAVQVKCTIAVLNNEKGYACYVCRSGEPYPKGSYDFLAAYVIPEDAWYIIPEDKVLGLKSISLGTEESRAKYEPYLEAWHLLQRTMRPGGTLDINACADETVYDDEAGLPFEVVLVR